MSGQDQKNFLLDMKYAKEKDAITIFTSTTIGSVALYGTVYSESNPRCPTEDDSDFLFGKFETQIQKSML